MCKMSTRLKFWSFSIFGRMIMSPSSFTLFFVRSHFLTGLGMENIGGIFVVLICGLIVAIFMAMLEFLWTLRHSEATEVNLLRGMTYSIGKQGQVHRLTQGQRSFQTELVKSHRRVGHPWNSSTAERIPVPRTGAQGSGFITY